MKLKVLSIFINKIVSSILNNILNKKKIIIIVDNIKININNYISLRLDNYLFYLFI